MVQSAPLLHAPPGEPPSTTGYSQDQIVRSLVDGIIGLEDGVALFDRGGVLVTCNNAYRRAYPLTADLLVPGVSIRTILEESARRGGYATTEAEVAEWTASRIERHFWCAGIGEHKLANDRWYRITERHTAAGDVFKFLSDITEQKRLDAALSAMDVRIREAIGSLEEGIALFGPDDRLVIWNRRYSEIFHRVADIIKVGVPFETLVRTAAARMQNIEAIRDPEDWIRGRLELHRQVSGTFEHHFTNGQWIQARERRTADGGVIGAFIDITPLKEREQKLQGTLRDLEDANTRIKNVIESTSDCIWTSDVAGNVTCEGRSYAGNSALDQGPFIAQALKMLIPDAPAGAEESQSDRATLINTPFRNIIHDACLPDGRAIHLRISGNPVYDRAKQFQGYCGAASDVTTMVEAQREAGRRSAMLQATVESTAQGIVVFDRQFQVQIANQHALAMLGRASLDDSLNALVGPELASRLRAWLAIRTSAEMPAVEHVGLTGSVMEVRANAMPDGGFVMTLTDLTERIKTEERFRQSEKMVALGHLVGGVAHEFNNLLTSIGGFSKVALDKADQVDMVRDCLEEVILASDRAADLTRQMLAYGRKQPVETKVFSADKILDDLERMLQSLLPVSIEFSIERTEEEIFVDNDVTQITQAVFNLLLNARDAMPSGGKLMLNLATGAMPAASGSENDDRNSGPCAIYRVTDTGTGIDDATLRQIFDPFFTTKEQGKGTGLGLSFVHAVVERSGGRITVESKIGAGTTFRIFLPQVARPSHATTADWEEFASCGGSETILVVEDERGVRNLVRSVLAEGGYQVLAAADRDQAVAFLKASPTPPDLLLTDVGLPGRSGPEIAEELLALMPDLKVIFMSGHADRDALNSHRLSGQAVLLDKPFSPVDLARTIRSVLDDTFIAKPGTGRHQSSGDDHDS